MDPFSKHFSATDKSRITEAVRLAEKETSGEIRVHIESKCKIDPLDRAAHVFKILKMHQTERRNGVLIYLAVDHRKFAIIGDAGINSVVPDTFWNDVKMKMVEYFTKGDFTEGLVAAIQLAGSKLKDFFPYQSDDINELSDEISFGK
ncbi:MAG: TPM domain-containing protein [Bacteroidales bacterium]|nr:TPM domain-containing protein [Bacteroidales bacterium]